MEDNIKNKRAILLTTRIRFSTKTQSIKERAIDKIIDKIIEQILYVYDKQEGLNLTEIQNNTGFDVYDFTINIVDIENSLNRLLKENTIILQKKDSENFYELTKRSIANLKQIEFQAKKIFKNIIDKLFKNSSLDKNKYSEPFLKFLCTIFSNLGEECVELILGKIDSKNFKSNIFNKALKLIKQEFSWIDYNNFKNVALKFFIEEDLDYNYIKWNMAQSYYIAKALGIGDSENILSEQIFYNSVFYLDTNILISALEPVDKNYQGFLVFNKACRRLGIQLKISGITLDELESWLASQYDLLKRVISCIPEELNEKVSSTLYKAYQKNLKENKDVKLEDIFDNFINPEDKLKREFSVDIIDDIWFEEERNNEKTKILARELKKKYSVMRKNRKKWNAAIHDALMLLWVAKKTDNKNTWFATLDGTLPGTKVNGNGNNLAITLGALLQWIAPLAIKKGEEKGFDAIFAEIIKLRLLPQEGIFDAKDFMIFHEMQIDCKSLPAQDVEMCLESIKKNCPNLNPSNPSDLIKLSYEVERFFLDTGRKFKSIEDQLKKRLAEYTEINEEITQKYEKLKKDSENKDLRQSAVNRIWLTVILQILLVFIVIYLIYRFGNGENLFQKISNSWSYLAGSFGFLLIFGPIFLGKKRIKSLDWRTKKILKL